jgi:iron(III) transport system ATP-binding protein
MAETPATPAAPAPATASATATAAALTVDHLCVAYDGVTEVLCGVDLVCEPGTITAVIGPSGAGKTSLLRAIAGLLPPFDGRIAIGGKLVQDGRRDLVPAEQRGVGLVFQHYALFPQMTVADNIGFGLAKKGRAARVGELLRLTGLEGYGQRLPETLSGGQQQRVALARALAPRPPVIGLDEPFANVDAERRHELGREIRAALVHEGVIGLLVTHDHQEALALADRIAVLEEGTVTGRSGARCVQVDSPEILYHHPRTRAIGGLLGPASWMPVQVVDGRADTVFGNVAVAGVTAGAAQLMLRPEQIGFTGDPAGPARVVDRWFGGPVQHLIVELAGVQVRVAHVGAHFVQPGQRGRVAVIEPLWAVANGE